MTSALHLLVDIDGVMCLNGVWDSGAVQCFVRIVELAVGRLGDDQKLDIVLISERRRSTHGQEDVFRRWESFIPADLSARIRFSVMPTWTHSDTTTMLSGDLRLLELLSWYYAMPKGDFGVVLDDMKYSHRTQAACSGRLSMVAVDPTTGLSAGDVADVGHILSKYFRREES